jgi:hypothetical protein
LAVLVPAGTALAGGGLQLVVDYSGVYGFHTTAYQHGSTLLSKVDQTFGWTWHAEGTPDPGGGLTPLQVTGTLDSSSANSAQHCTYDAGTDAAAPIDASELYADFSYATGIPGATATCNGVRGGQSDPLACDFTGCSTLCTDPPAVTTDKFQTPVLTAFKPTTSYLPAPATSFVDAQGDWGTITQSFDLPSAAGVIDGSCPGTITESGQMTITSQVTISLLDTRDGFTLNFKDGVWPDPLHPISILDPPGGPYAPIVIVPPKTDQPPEVTLPPPATDSAPVVGIIGIRCPRRDGHCRGTVVVTGTGTASRTIGHRAFVTTGGHEALVAVALAANVRATLRRSGHTTVRVRIASVTTPGSRHFHASRTVQLIAYRPVTGAPS